MAVEAGGDRQEGMDEGESDDLRVFEVVVLWRYRGHAKAQKHRFEIGS